MATMLVLVACGGGNDRLAMTKFFPLAADEFRYEATADALYPAESPAAEADRIAWLETYLRNGAHCPGGYVIVDRTVVRISEGVFGNLDQINYLGRCA